MSVLIWVKDRTNSEEAMKVPYRTEMDCSELKDAINMKRKHSNLLDKGIQSIHNKNSNDEEHKLKPGAIIPNTVDGEIGSSEDFPYYYTFVQDTGNLDFYLTYLFCINRSIHRKFIQILI